MLRKANETNKEMKKVIKLKESDLHRIIKRVLNEQTGRNESKSEKWNELIWKNKRNPKSYDEAYNCFNDNGIPYNGRRAKIVYNSCFDVDGEKFMPDSPPCIEIINHLSIRKELNDDIIKCLLS